MTRDEARAEATRRAHVLDAARDRYGLGSPEHLAAIAGLADALAMYELAAAL